MCPVIGDTYFDHLIKGLPDRFPTLKYSFPFCNYKYFVEYFETV